MGTGNLALGIQQPGCEADHFFYQLLRLRMSAVIIKVLNV
jgi:hypothetical protein